MRNLYKVKSLATVVRVKWTFAQSESINKIVMCCNYNDVRQVDITVISGDGTFV